MDLCNNDHIKRLITLSVIKLNGFHCINLNSTDDFSYPCEVIAG